MQQDFITYIFENKPDECIAICKSYGYDPQSDEETEMTMMEIIGQEGQPAFQKFMDLHPDKNVLVEMFGGQVSQSCGDSAGRCSNPNCAKCQKLSKVYQQTMSATGEASTMQSMQNKLLTTYKENRMLTLSIIGLLVVVIVVSKNN